MADPTAHLREHYDRQAGRYDRQIGVAEWLLLRDGRRWVCEQAEGKVLEIAAGTARNLPFYRSGLELTAIELSPAMLAIAERRAGGLGRTVDLRLGDAQSLAFPDGAFDTVVCALGLSRSPSPEPPAGQPRRRRRATAARRSSVRSSL